MKKMITVCVAILMIFTLIGCHHKEASIIGKWKRDGEGDYYFIFKENDVLNVEISGLTAEGSYETDGEKISFTLSILEQTIMNEEGTYQLDDDKLTITIDGDSENFTRVKE